MSSLLYESLNEELEDLLDKVKKRLQVDISRSENTEERKRITSRLESSLNEAKILLGKMEIETLKAPSKAKAVMNVKISNYRKEINRYQCILNNERYMATEGTHIGSSNMDEELRRQILMGTASLERTSDSLARSEAIAIETEQVGTEVLGELGSQRDTLVRTRDRLGETKEEISRSKRILRAMGRNVFYNKILLILIIILEICILGGLIYWKFFT